MELNGTKTIMCRPADIAAGLRNGRVLAHCLPGCTRLEGNPATGAEAEFSHSLGVRLVCDLTVTELERNRRFELRLAGRGVVGKGAGGVVEIDMRGTRDGGTRLTYQASGRSGGVLARFGAALIDDFAARAAGGFLGHLQAWAENRAARLRA